MASRAASNSHLRAGEWVAGSFSSPGCLPYAINALSPRCAAAVNSALGLRADLNVERVDVSHFAAGFAAIAFLLVDDDTDLAAPPTPFASPRWEAHITRALVANAVLVPASRFVEAARSRALPALHAALWGRQFFHRATAALAARRRASQWLLSMRGLMVSVPISTGDDLALARQCREADLRMEPFRSGSQSLAHFRIESRAKGNTVHVPWIALEDVEALRPFSIGERRSVFSELFIAAMAPFRAPPY